MGNLLALLAQARAVWQRSDMLRRAGVQVTVYDRYDRAGGLLTYGIPGFKLEKDVVMQRVAQLEEGGIEIVTNCNVGVDMSFEEICNKHDAVIIATGVYKSRDLAGPGSGADGIVKAIDYLTTSNRHGFGDNVPKFDDGSLNAAGKRVCGSLAAAIPQWTAWRTANPSRRDLCKMPLPPR